MNAQEAYKITCPDLADDPVKVADSVDRIKAAIQKNHDDKVKERFDDFDEYITFRQEIGGSDLEWLRDHYFSMRRCGGIERTKFYQWVEDTTK